MLAVGALLTPPAHAAAADGGVRVTSLRPIATSVVAGGTFAVRETTKNNSTHTVRGSRTGYYLAPSRKTVEGRVTLTGARTIKKLSRRRSSVATSQTLTVPKTTAAGRYFVVACAADARKLPKRGRWPARCKVAKNAVQVIRAQTPLSEIQPLPAPGPASLPAPAPAPAATPTPTPSLTPTPAANPLDRFLPDGALTLSGIDVHGFNDVTNTLTFQLSEGAFSTKADDTTLEIGASVVDPDQVKVTADAGVVTGALKDGRNAIELRSVDQDGRPLYHHAEAWAGSADLTVALKTATGDPYAESAAVGLALADVPSLRLSAATSTGSATFHHVPDTGLLVDAAGPGGARGSGGGVLADSPLAVVMHTIGAPSQVANNDFSQGSDGWDIGTAPVTISPHVEDVGPNALGATPAQSASRSSRASFKPHSPVRQVELRAEQAAIVDQDLTLNTLGEGQQSISRTFKTEPGVTGVRLRYRFVTSEVPGGFFGSQYNDYFRVALASQKGGGNVDEANSMNGLGLAAFDADGSTAWREITLPTDDGDEGDTIRVDLGVANVADDLLDSSVVVDFVEELKTRIVPSLSWNTTSGGLDLRYTVEGEKLVSARDITLRFANGPGHGDRVGATLFTQTVPKDTAAGSYGPFHISGSSLVGAPAGITYLVASARPNEVGPIPEVQLGYGANADPAVVSTGMVAAVKESLRIAGQATATITSTARTPTDQARAMFNNLTNQQHSIAENIAIQHGIYGPAGDAVIDTFAGDADGLTPEQVQQAAGTIRDDMVDEINAQGCPNVSRHCADPAVISVVDIGASAFSASNGTLFVGAAAARVTHLIDERATNGCFHLELAAAP